MATGGTPTPRVIALRASRLLQDVAALGLDAPSDSAVLAVMPYRARARAEAAARVLAQRGGLSFTLLAVEDDAGTGPMDVWNRVWRASAQAWFVYVADDAFPGRGWLRQALSVVQNDPGAGLFAFNDGKWFGQMAGFGMVRRSWLQTWQPESLFHPEYRQHYGDVELSLVARQQGAMRYDPQAVLIEVDHGKDHRPVNAEDRALFLARRNQGFDGRVSDPQLLTLFG